MDTPLHALNRAVEACGSQAELARQIGRSQPTVWYWINKLGRVPGEDVLAVEAASGVTRHQLRPDLFGEGPTQSSEAA